MPVYLKVIIDRDEGDDFIQENKQRVYSVGFVRTHVARRGQAIGPEFCRQNSCIVCDWQYRTIGEGELEKT